MQIKVSDIKPNPFRFAGMNICPLDEAVVKKLLASIKENEFWDNIPVRNAPDGKGYELGYGHHRLEALKRLKIKEIEITKVFKWDDAHMLRVMANENMENWGAKPAIVIHAVEEVNRFLSENLKGLQWDKGKAGKFTHLFEGRGGFLDAEAEHRKTGFWGSRTITNFLGAAWDRNNVRLALDILKRRNYRKAIELFPVMNQARLFKSMLSHLDLTENESQLVARNVKPQFEKRSTETGIPGVNSASQQYDRMRDAIMDSVEHDLIPRSDQARAKGLRKQLSDARQKFLNPNWKVARDAANATTRNFKKSCTSEEHLKMNYGEVSSLRFSIETLLEQANELLEIIGRKEIEIEVEATHVS